MLGLAVVWLFACDSLWSQFQGPNPINCVLNPDSCTEGQVCNVQTRLCESQNTQPMNPAAALSLLAGSLGGAGNVDDLGPAARFTNPASVAADGAGNLYVADSVNHTIRKIALSSGAVATIAGTAGTMGSADGTGSLAAFRSPAGLATDGPGTLYVADTGNHTIRKILVGTGEVTTIAGVAGIPGSGDGTGALARFFEPSALATDGAGNLYIADSKNHTIRRLVLSTGAVATLAGTAGSPGSSDGTGSAARFRLPSGLAADAGGNLFAADTGNHTIRKIGLGGGAVTTIAGGVGVTGNLDGMGNAARFSSPSGLAADGAGNFYVADRDNHTIRKLVPATLNVVTVAGTASQSGGDDGTGSAARFFRPSSVTSDGAGNLYVADFSNHTIRKLVLSSGAVTTTAGTAGMNGAADGASSGARFDNPFGIVSDGADALYVADRFNHTIRKVVLSTGMVTTLAGTAGALGSSDASGASARFNFPFGVASAGPADRYLYVADSNNHTVRQISLSSGEVTTVAGSAGTVGELDGVGTGALFNHPFGIVADAAGNLYVADRFNHTIRKVVPSTRQVTTLAGTAALSGSADAVGTAARFNNPFGLALDGLGNLYVADSNNHTIRKVVLSTGAVTTLAGTAGVSGSTDGAGAAARFWQPSGLAADGVGNLYVADAFNHTLRKIRLANATVTTLAGLAKQAGVKLGALPARLSYPNGVAVLPTGAIFVSTATENAILAIR